MVIDGGGAVEYALWGGLLSRLGLERGLAGVVVDGAVRDLDEIEAMGFPAFALTALPTAREIPVSLRAEMLEARFIALVRFP